MVLRRPYAFLIKHFRFIHLVITAILVYIAFKYRSIYIYLGKCISDSVNRYDATNYINYWLLFLIVIVIFLFFVVYWLLKYKDKPRYIYVMSIVGYVVLWIVLLATFIYLGSFNTNLIEQKTIRLYRDILFMCNLFQYYVAIVMFIRGLGFDIKKFNFGKDVQELNLSQEDAEEIEVNIVIDTTNIVREIRKQGREFGYFFKEYKIYIIIILTLLIIFLGYKGYGYFTDHFKTYKQNVYVGEKKFINITNSYYDIDNDKYVIIKFNTYTNGIKDKLNTGNILLYVDDEKYVANKNVCYKFNSIGTCYKQQYIDNDVSEYILVYKVDEVNVKKTYILYSESYDKTFKIKLDLKNNESD